MCGFAGFYLKREPVPSALIETMTSKIQHRGPDDWGYFGVGETGRTRIWKTDTDSSPIKVGMGFRRLSILDLSPNGAQPMQSPDGRYTLCFNGQIYNYLELRKELKDSSFRSTGDTEVLLQAFAQWGIDGLRKFDAMFAFSIYDSEKKQTTIARDPLGIKPLYYFEDERGFFYGSELRALWPAFARKPSLRRELVSRYLMSNWIPAPDTLFEGIHKLEPGHFIVVNSEGVKIQRYWELEYSPEELITDEAWRAELNSALQTTVDRQLRSDVPVGFFLSGGIDSSLLVTRAMQVRSDRPTTFTIGFQWSKAKEFELDIQAARVLRDKFDIDYNEIVLEPSIVSLLPKVVTTLEEPVADPAAICSYLICEAASARFKVLISGQGGDELFGGYPVYQAGMIASRVQKLPTLLNGFFRQTARFLPYSAGGHEIRSVHRLQRLFNSVRRPWPEPFLLLRSPFALDELADLITPSLFDEQVSAFTKHLSYFETVRHEDRWNQMMFLDTKTYLPSTNLAYSDKTSMAHSVELRVPLLGMEMVNLARRLPTRLKASMKESKILLKRLAAEQLPPELVTRKKAGFGLPLRDWFQKDLQPLGYELLSESRLKGQGLFNPSLPSRWLREHREMKADHSMKLYSLMTYHLWLEQFEISI